MAVNSEYRAHRETWESFCRLMTVGTISAVIILAGMAIFLV